MTETLSSLRGKKCVVTGGAGFIGSHLAEQLLEQGAEVVVLDDLRAGKRERVPQKARFIEADINDKKSSEAFKGAEIIFHLAAIPGVPVSIEDPLGTHTVNVDGMANVFEAARASGARRVVFASSAAVYGDQEVSTFTEDMELKPMSPYALHKVIGEYTGKTWAAVYGLEAVSLRFFNVYGPHMDPAGPYAAVVGKFLEWRAKGAPLMITGDGEQTRDFVYVTDIAHACMLAATSSNVGKGEAINIGTGAGVSVNEVASIIGGETEHVPPRLEIKHAVANITKAKELLDYQPQIDFQSGLRALLKI